MATFLEGQDMNEAQYCQSMAHEYFISWNLNEMGSGKVNKI